MFGSTWKDWLSICVRGNALPVFFRSVTRPHPLRRILFYSSDGTLNLGHHLDRENRPHIRGRWWWGAAWWVCESVCGMRRRVVTGFLILPGGENQIKLTFQPNAPPTIIFLFFPIYCFCSHSAHPHLLRLRLPLQKEKKKKNQSEALHLLHRLLPFPLQYFLSDFSSLAEPGGGTCKWCYPAPWQGIREANKLHKRSDTGGIGCDEERVFNIHCVCLSDACLKSTRFFSSSF